MNVRQFFRPFARLFLLDLIKDKQARPVFFYSIFTIGVSSWFFHQFEGWGWLDATYFSVITMTTIGYGDLVPHTPAGKIMTIFLGLNGIVILLTLFDHIRRIRSHRERPALRKLARSVQAIKTEVGGADASEPPHID